MIIGDVRGKSSGVLPGRGSGTLGVRDFDRTPSVFVSQNYGDRLLSGPPQVTSSAELRNN